LDYDPSQIWLQKPDGTRLADKECLDVYGFVEPMEEYHTASKAIAVGPLRIHIAQENLAKVQEDQYEVTELEKAYLACPKEEEDRKADLEHQLTLARQGKPNKAIRQQHIDEATGALAKAKSDFEAAKAGLLDAQARMNLEIVFKKPPVGFPSELTVRPTASIAVPTSEFFVRNAHRHLLGREPTDEEYETCISILEAHSIGGEQGSMSPAEFLTWFLTREETVNETKTSAYAAGGTFETSTRKKLVQLVQDDDATFVRLAFAVFQGTAPTDSELSTYTHMLDIETFTRPALAQELSGPKFYDEIDAARKAPACVIDPVWRPRPVDENGNIILNEEEKTLMAHQVKFTLN